MTRLHLPSPFSPGSMHPENATNGATPRASFLRRAADDLNTIAVYHKKVLTAKCQNINAVKAGILAATSQWPFYFRTGENSTGVSLNVGLVDTAYAATSPRLDVALKLASDGSTIDSQSVYYNGRKAPSNRWEIINRTALSVVNLTGASANTEYYVTISGVDGIRLLYLSAHELSNRHADDSVTGVTDPSAFIEGGPIYNAHVQDLLDAGDKHWRHSGCHYLSWSADCQVAITVSATSYTNVMDMSSTTVSANTPGCTIASQYHGTATTAAAGPAVKIAVQATRLTGTDTLSVRLYDGTNAIELTGISTGGVGDWYTGTGTIPSQIAKWDVQAKIVGGGGGTFDLMAVCVFAYTA